MTEQPLRRVLEAARFVLEQEQEIVQDGYVASLVRLRHAVEAVQATQATAAVVDRPLTQDELAAFYGPDDEAVVDYTEQARDLAEKLVLKLKERAVHGYAGQPWMPASEELTPDIAAALSAVASERQAEIAALRKGEAAWIRRVAAAVATTSRVQQAHEAKLARLQEPEVQDAVAKAFGEVICSQLELERIGEGDKQRVHFTLRGKALDFSAATIAAITVIKEILK